MKKLMMLVILGGAMGAQAIENPKAIYGKECSINTYDSYEEAGHIGKFGMDSHESFVALTGMLKANHYAYHSEPMKLYYFKDYEFLIELKRESGRGSDHHLSLRIMRTGKYGEYATVFNVEAANIGDEDAVARSLIRQIPPCIKI